MPSPLSKQNKLPTPSRMFGGNPAWRSANPALPDPNDPCPDPRDPLYRQPLMDGPWIPSTYDDMRFQQFRSRMDYEPGWHVVVGAARNASIGDLFSNPNVEPEIPAEFLANVPPEISSRPLVHVKGSISSAPLDLPDRANRFRDEVGRRGWLWYEWGGFDTDVRSIFGIPLPKSYSFEGIMSPKDGHTPTADEAQALIGDIMKMLDLNYSATGAWIREVNKEVIQPTIKQAGAVAALGLGAYALWIGGGLAALMLLSKKGI